MSKRMLGSACAAAVLSFTVGVAAQSGNQTPTPSSDTQGTTTRAPAPGTSRATQGTHEVTVTGCVMKPTGTSGTTAKGTDLVLMHAMMSGRNAAAGATAAAEPSNRSGQPDQTARNERPTDRTRSSEGTVGTTGTDSAASADRKGMSYTLTGSHVGELEQYVGRRVEVMGTTTRTKPDSSANSASSRETPPSTGVSPRTSMPELTVASYRPLTGTCD